MLKPIPSFNSISDILLWRWPLKLTIVLCALIASVAGLAAPFFQQQFFINLEMTPFILCCFLMFVYFLFYQLTQFLSDQESVLTQHQLALNLYRQILKLNSQAKLGRTTGEMVSLYTTDVPSLTMWIQQTLPYVLTTFIPLGLTPFFLKFYYHIPLFDSFLFLLVLIILSSLMALRQSRFFYHFKILAAERMSLVNEWIQNIKHLRVLSWMNIFEDRILQKRIEETENRVGMVTNGQIMNSFSSSITFWFNLAILTFFIFHFNDPDRVVVTKSDILILIWVVGVFLSRPIRQLPWLLTIFFDALTSFRRLSNFFKLVNQPSFIKYAQPEGNELLNIKNLNLVLGDRIILKNINLKLRPHEVVALIGPVGSGKSMLIKSILDEVSVSADAVYCAPSAYLPQEPFIFSSSIAQNLTFKYESDYDAELCFEALDRAQFTQDLKFFPNSLESTIGERGLNISGGQKQRLHLARLFYGNKKLFLLDDPFSAVDIATEQKLIQSILQTKRDGAGFLVVTQRYDFLKHADRIVYIEDGMLQYDGHYGDFIKVEKYLKFIEQNREPNEI